MVVLKSISNLNMKKLSIHAHECDKQFSQKCQPKIHIESIHAQLYKSMQSCIIHAQSVINH